MKSEFLNGGILLQTILKYCDISSGSKDLPKQMENQPRHPERRKFERRGSDSARSVVDPTWSFLRHHHEFDGLNTVRGIVFNSVLG